MRISSIANHGYGLWSICKACFATNSTAVGFSLITGNERYSLHTERVRRKRENLRMERKSVAGLAEIRVSSVLNRNRKENGKKFLTDGEPDTCWCSDQGASQWIAFRWGAPVSVDGVRIKFQVCLRCIHKVVLFWAAKGNRTQSSNWSTGKNTLRFFGHTR